MNKLKLLTIVSAAALVPLAAHAGYKHTKTTTYYKDAKHSQTDAVDMKVRIENQNTAMKRNGTYNLANSNESIQVKDGALYLIEPNGSKYLAPTGPYTTREGITFFSDYGDLTRALGPDKIVYVDPDLQDNDHDGYADDIDVNVETHSVQ